MKNKTGHPIVFTSEYCSVFGCQNLRSNRSQYCSSHRHKKERYGDPTISKILSPDLKRLCMVEGCDRHSEARGYCNMHSRRVKRNGIPSTKRIKDNPLCSIPWCKRKRKTNGYKGYCQFHYVLVRRVDTSKTFEEIWGKPPYVCHICGKEHDKCLPTTMEMDHIIPRSKGGTNDRSNLALSCIECNRAKRDIPMNRFIKMCQRVVQHHSSSK